MIEEGRKIELRAELQSFSTHPAGLGTGIQELEKTYGDVAIIDLPEGYNIPYLKEDATWNGTKERKYTLEKLFEDLMEMYRGQHVEILLVTHSGVIGKVLGLGEFDSC